MMIMTIPHDLSYCSARFLTYSVIPRYCSTGNKASSRATVESAQVERAVPRGCSGSEHHVTESSTPSKPSGAAAGLGGAVNSAPSSRHSIPFIQHCNYPHLSTLLPRPQSHTPRQVQSPTYSRRTDSLQEPTLPASFS